MYCVVALDTYGLQIGGVERYFRVAYVRRRYVLNVVCKVGGAAASQLLLARKLVSFIHRRPFR